MKARRLPRSLCGTALAVFAGIAPAVAAPTPSGPVSPNIAGLPKPQAVNLPALKDKMPRLLLGGNLPPPPAPDITVVFGEAAPAGAALQTTGTLTGPGVTLAGARRGLRVTQAGDGARIFYRTTPAMKTQSVVVECDVPEGSSVSVALEHVNVAGNDPVSLRTLRVPVTETRARFLVDPSPDIDGMLIVALSSGDGAASGTGTTVNGVLVLPGTVGGLSALAGSNLLPSGSSSLTPATLERCRIKRL